MATTILLWNGEKYSCNDKVTAIKMVKELLSNWMNDDDYIGYHHEPKKTIAVVYDSSCEPTDAFAEIR